MGTIKAQKEARGAGRTQGLEEAEAECWRLLADVTSRIPGGLVKVDFRGRRRDGDGGVVDIRCPRGRPYRRGWCRGRRGKDEGLEEEEQEGMEASEAVAAASSASSSSPWSSWLTLDCRAAGVSHSLGRQLCRKGTQELK